MIRYNTGDVAGAGADLRRALDLGLEEPQRTEVANALDALAMIEATLER